MRAEEHKKRTVSRQKAEQFKKHAVEYIEGRERIPTGFRMQNEIKRSKQRIIDAFGATVEDWNNWQWQLRNRIDNADKLKKIFPLTEVQEKDFAEIGRVFRWGFTPHVASLMHPENEVCPVRMQMLPDIKEMAMTGNPDFSGEEYSSPVENLVRWYPDRVAVHITNICTGFCRHCLRRRKIGEVDRPIEDSNLEEILDYLKKNPEIRDVLLTGGDPLTFADGKLDEILTELDAIEHVEIKRIGSRAPVVLPQRVDRSLCDMLSRHHPLFINIQVNHPLEITPEMAAACDLLTRAGIPLGNQSVLLKNINDSPDIIKLLNHELLKVRVRPYYLYHCQGTIGTEHFRTPVEKGIEILENLRGFTTGLAVPDFIITPHGYGKTPLMPNYRLSSGDGYLLLRNWEGLVYRYANPR